VKFKWQDIEGNKLQRAKVFGGWLIKTTEPVCHAGIVSTEYGFDYRVSICFMPDKKHEWRLG
jgi:hypothetical protein